MAERKFTASYAAYEKLGTTELAVLDACDYYNIGLIITRINVPRAHRGKGVARRLLKKICDDADQMGITLYLEISPSDGLNYEQLRDWYMRAGFEYWGGFYKRKAKVKT